MDTLVQRDRARLIDTHERFESAIAAINMHDEIVVDTETTGLEWSGSDRVCGVSVLAGPCAFYFPFRHNEGQNLDESHLRRLAGDVLRPDRVHGGFNYSFDIKMLAKDGMQMPDRIWDSILSAHMLNENEASFKMENLAAKYLDASYASAENVLLDKLVDRFGGTHKTAKKNLWRLDPLDVWEYACQDVHTTRDLRDFHRPYLSEWELAELMEEVYEWQRYVIEMEQRGIKLDIPHLYELQARAHAEQAELLKWIQADAGYPLNPRSSVQVNAWLGVHSSAKGALHGRDDERVLKLLDYRFWSKVDDSYYKKFLNRVTPAGTLHYNLRVGGTATGRLSASNVNITAIPRDSKRSPVKDVFIARDPDHTLVEIDYSQAELRFCAHYSQDPTFCEMILSGTDMHQRTADQLGIPRNPLAKNVNFSIWYNIGWKTFSKNYHVSAAVAKKTLADYHAWIPGVRRLIRSAEHQAEKQGYIRMYTGRVRRFNSIRAPTYTASSGLIQGGVAEMLRIAMMRIRRELPHVRQLTPIHDAGLFEVPKRGLDETVHEMTRIMQDQPWCSMPMIVDRKTGDRWGGTMKELPRTPVGIPAHALEKCTDPTIMGEPK